MGLAGWLTEIVGSAEVLILGGAMIAIAGLAGILIPAVRNAR